MDVMMVRHLQLYGAHSVKLRGDWRLDCRPQWVEFADWFARIKDSRQRYGRKAEQKAHQQNKAYSF